MKIKTMALAALLATGSIMAWAEEMSTFVTLESHAPGAWSTFATALHGAPGPFTDSFFFAAFPHAVLVDGNLSSTNLGSAASNIDFTSASLSNGSTAVQFAFSTNEWSFMGMPYSFKTGTLAAPTTFEANLPLTLTVSGVAASGWQPALGNVAASYNSNLNFAAAAVPESSTFAMLFAGLAFVGWAAKRRPS